MKKASSLIKKRWKTFDDTLINPPKDHSGELRNYKGQSINQKAIDNNVQPNP
jgi:hypothetical protein